MKNEKMKKPFLTFEEVLAALRFAANPNVSMPERRRALFDVTEHLDQFPDYEINPDGSATVLFQDPDGKARTVTIPPLTRNADVLNFQLRS